MEVIKLEGPPFNKLQCECPKEDLNPATLGWKGYREKRSVQNNLNPDYCMRHVRWKIDGVRMCTQHAGIAALKYLEGKSK